MTATMEPDNALFDATAAGASNGAGGGEPNPVADRPPKSKRRPGPRTPKAGPPPAPSASKRGPGRPPKAANLEKKLADNIAMVGVVVGSFGIRGFDPSDPKPTPLMLDGSAIVAGAPRLAGALVKLGDENPAIRLWLERAVAASTYGELIAATAAIALPILSNHGLVPAGLPIPGADSAPPPEGPPGVGND